MSTYFPRHRHPLPGYLPPAEKQNLSALLAYLASFRALLNKVKKKFEELVKENCKHKKWKKQKCRPKDDNQLSLLWIRVSH